PGPWRDEQRRLLVGAPARHVQRIEFSVARIDIAGGGHGLLRSGIKQMPLIQTEDAPANDCRKTQDATLQPETVMGRGKRYLSDLDLPMGAFQVRPDWYEEYWLTPEKAPPARSRSPRWSVYAGLAAAVIAMVVVFVGH